MTVCKGVLLFDIPGEPIGHWVNETGWRGMREQWYLDNAPHITLAIDPFEDNDDEWEVYIVNNNTGYWESIGFGTYDTCEQIAEKYMEEHKNG